jgi:dTDP-4-dehydrorhamnose 3,5-epimerase
MVIRFARFLDHRGFFTEHYRDSDISRHEGLECLREVQFRQMNESFSRAGTIRGMHFQWNPFMGKLVRPVTGRLIDLILDIRKGSPTFGRMIAYDMPSRMDDEFAEWIWVPPGFAHGVLFTEDTLIEYFCSAEWSPGCEAAISPLSPDLDWSLCDPSLKAIFDEIAATTQRITDKDRLAPGVSAWADDPRSTQFLYGPPSRRLGEESSALQADRGQQTRGAGRTAPGEEAGRSADPSPRGGHLLFEPL